MSEVMRVGWLTVDFFTHSYRISGQVDVGRRSIVDILNDRTTSFVQLEDAYISPIDRPGDIVATYAASGLVKANLTLALVSDEEEALARKETYGSYYGTYLRKVFVTVPAFEVTGFLRLSSPRVDMRLLFSSDSDDFITALDCRVRASIRSDVTFSGGGVLVNRHHIGAFCLAEEE